MMNNMRSEMRSEMVPQEAEAESDPEPEPELASSGYESCRWKGRVKRTRKHRRPDALYSLL